MGFTFAFICILAIFSVSRVECRKFPQNRQAVAQAGTTAAYGPSAAPTPAPTPSSAYTTTTPKVNSPSSTASVSPNVTPSTMTQSPPLTTFYAPYYNSGNSGSAGGSAGSKFHQSISDGTANGSSGSGPSNTDPFLLPQPGPSANPTTTPSPNNAAFVTQSTRPACNGNSGKTCDPTGGPGLNKQPNFLIFIPDDLGSADLSYKEGNLQTPTPNIDKLAWDGIILNRHYINPICTPGRAAFITGKYTFRTGMQTAALSEGEPWGLPLNFKTAPQYMKDLGYDTWGVGKWHLGNHQRAYFPDSRGFDETYMITGGECNWFNYTTGWITPEPTEGLILRQNSKVVFANITSNNYMPELFTTVAEKMIRNANPNNPFWLYFATTVVHTAFEPYGAVIHTMPQYQLRPVVFSFSDKFPERKRQLALVQMMDESFKRLVDALTYKGILNNTIIVFFGDNGAPLPQLGALTHGSNYGSNWPLRHGKGSHFDGGVRTDSFIWSPLLPKRGRITDQLFHATDWLPTMYEAAGGDVNQLGDRPGDLSGVSQWKSLYNGLNYGPRTELVLNIDTMFNQSAMVYQDSFGGLYKLIKGNVLNNAFFGWFRTPNTSDSDPQTVWTPTKVNCNFPPGIEVTLCRPLLSDCLFDLVNDPCETNNIATSYPSMVELLNKKIVAYNTTAIPAVITMYDPASNPNRWQGLWVPWQDAEPLDKVPLTFMPFNPSNSY